jgi:hypothetical protein
VFFSLVSITEGAAQALHAHGLPMVAGTSTQTHSQPIQPLNRPSGSWNLGPVTDQPVVPAPSHTAMPAIPIISSSMPSSFGTGYGALENLASNSPSGSNSKQNCTESINRTKKKKRHKAFNMNALYTLETNPRQYLPPLPYQLQWCFVSTCIHTWRSVLMIHSLQMCLMI